jgi:NADH-quinone oxidoreductase subunit F
VPFFKGQKKIVLRNCGFINPDDIEEYMAVGGYQALYKVLIDGRPESVIEQIKASKLRGRGGAGYLTGNKWEYLRKAKADRKYIICNADEGDPGAYMNRNEIESDPHSLLEGMIIGGYAMGASEGIVYVRAEYPLAVHRLTRAIEQAASTAARATTSSAAASTSTSNWWKARAPSSAARRPRSSPRWKAGRTPRPRPPYPAQKGLWGMPTNINNVETWYNVAPIVMKGPAWFTETGSAKSSGTKVFSLVGKITEHRPGRDAARHAAQDLRLRHRRRRRHQRHAIKAVQTGGPSGGCIPQDMFDTRWTTRALAQLGSIMGSGGMVVMDEDNCMVDVARYFIEFTHSESCGKCVPCRVGLDKALRVLNGFTRGPTRRTIWRRSTTGPHDPRHVRCAAWASRRRIRC